MNLDAVSYEPVCVDTTRAYQACPIVGNIQIDCPTIAFLCADATVQGYADANIDVQDVLSNYISLLNDCVKRKLEGDVL
jgi:hypothetical protein